MVGILGTRQAHPEQERHEVLLGAVVEVALEPSPLRVSSCHDPGAGPAELAELGQRLSLQALVVQGEVHGGGQITDPAWRDVGAVAEHGDGCIVRPDGGGTAVWSVEAWGWCTLGVDEAGAVGRRVGGDETRVSEPRRQAPDEVVTRGKPADEAGQVGRSAVRPRPWRPPKP